MTEEAKSGAPQADPLVIAGGRPLTPQAGADAMIRYATERATDLT
ncbi:hypothetical protein ACIQOF_07640 [Streptomyces sp. NPDC091265]